MNMAEGAGGAMTDRDSREQQMRDTLQILGSMPSLLLSSGVNCDAAIDESLVRIGRHFAASRVYVMLNEKNGRYLRNTHEWVDTATGSQLLPWPLYDCEYDVPSLKELILEHKVFFGHSRNVPKDLDHVMSKQGVRSFVIAPIVQDRHSVGIVGMDYCTEENGFHEDSALVLEYLSGWIAMALERKKYLSMRSKATAIRDILADLDPWSEPGITAESVARPPRPVTLLDAERRIIIETLELYNGNKLKTAKHLGLTWPSLDRRCKKLGIEVKRK